VPHTREWVLQSGDDDLVFGTDPNQGLRFERDGVPNPGYAQRGVATQSMSFGAADRREQYGGENGDGAFQGHFEEVAKPLPAPGQSIGEACTPTEADPEHDVRALSLARQHRNRRGASTTESVRDARPHRVHESTGICALFAAPGPNSAAESP
jgi:hypothetical protein